jgi:hypothetical protein
MGIMMLYSISTLLLELEGRVEVFESNFGLQSSSEVDAVSRSCAFEDATFTTAKKMEDKETLSLNLRLGLKLKLTT